MREGQFRRMPVLDEDGKPIGVVTLGDLAKHVESPERMNEKLREISEPHRSREAPEEAAGRAAETEGADGRRSKPATGVWLIGQSLDFHDAAAGIGLRRRHRDDGALRLGPASLRLIALLALFAAAWSGSFPPRKP